MGRHAKASRVTSRVAVVSTVLAVVAGYGAWGVTPAYAASLPGSSFEIDDDANLVVDAGGLDWSSVAESSKADQPTGTSDDSFTQGTKEDDTSPTVDAGSIPNNKSDLKNFGLYVEKTANGVYLNVYWTRVQEPNGTTNMDFEFNQSSTTSNNPASGPQIIPVRTAGDLLLMYDVDKGGKVATISKRTWTGTEWGPATTLTSTQAIGTINSTAIAAGDSAGLGALSERTFGEASVDLLALLPPEQGCITYGSVYLKSRASDAFTAELKDFIAPMSAAISNCGVVKITKTDDNGTLAGAGFTLYKDAAPLGGSRGAEDTVAAGSCAPTGSDGVCLIKDVKKGDYWLVETTVPAGHDPVATQLVSITSGDQVVELTLKDPIQKGTITIVKDAIPDDGQDFGFTIDGDAFTLDDDADPTRSNTQSFVVPVGQHTVVEGTTTGWSLTGIVCSTGGSGSVPTRTATISLVKGATVTCTFTNNYNPGDVNLQTTAVNAQGDAWNDSATMTGDGVHPVTGNVTFYACAPTATATGCATGGTQVGTPVAVTHGSGTTYVASTSTPYTPPTAGWTCFRAEFVSTSGFYANDSHTNATTECFLKQWADLTVSKTATAAFGRAYAWTIEKDVDASSVDIAAGDSVVSTYTVSVGRTSTDSSWTVTGDITVSNPNPVPFTGVAVTDAIDNGAGSCAVTGGASVTVPAGGTAVLPYTCTYAGAPAPASGTNTATATWDGTAFFTPHSSATGTAAVDFGAVTPSTTDESIDVTDSVVGDLGTVTVSDPNPKVFTYTVTRPGVAGTCTTYPNTAAFETNDTETTGSSSESVEICVGSDLTADMTASGSYDRTDLWDIAKEVDQTTVTVEDGQTATFTYTVTATPNGSTEGNHGVVGTVTVANPNDWEDVVADVTVTTDLGGTPTCTVTGGDDVTVPASGTVELAYACTFAGTPSHAGAVAATVAWDGDAASTPTGQTGDTASVALDLANETDAVVTVVDDKTDPNTPVTLGTAEWADDPTVFTYTLTKTAAGSACATYTNIAVLAETGQNATVDVEVCGFTGGGGGVVVPNLPQTGDMTGLLLRIAAGLLLSGLVLVVVSRRRRQA